MAQFCRGDGKLRKAKIQARAKLHLNKTIFASPFYNQIDFSVFTFPVSLNNFEAVKHEMGFS
jgi:hypothetical protein